MSGSAVLLGTVTSFDGARGIGEVTLATGRLLPFHCTAIADGSRTIAVGTAVACTAEPGHRGKVEARGLIAT